MSYIMSLLLCPMLFTVGIAQSRTKSVHDIRQYDFQNFAYHAGGESVLVSDGRGTYQGRAKEVFSYSVERVCVAYGDLTGDGQEEAAVTLYYTGGGTGAFSKGFVFTLRQGRPVLLAPFAGGDRADGGIREVSIRGGLLRVRREEPERMGDVPVGLCCPLYLITTTYRWDGGRLVRVGEAEKADAN